MEVSNETASQQSAPSASQQVEPSQQQASSVIDLDGVSKFKFQEKEWTPEDFKSYLDEESGWKEKYNSFETERRFHENLSHDLKSVRLNPALAQEFKKVYPEKFHAYLDLVLSQDAASTDSSKTQAQLPPEIMQKLSKLDTLEQKFHQAEVDAVNARLDKVLPPLFSKYPFANEDAVLAKAEALNQKGYKVTDSVWERLIKTHHEETKKLVDTHYKKTLDEQINKGKQAKDMGSGGSAPGAAPVAPRTIAEATQQALAHFKSQGR